MTLTVYILSNHTGHLLPNTNMHAKFGDYEYIISTLQTKPTIM